MIVYCTFPDDAVAREIASSLVAERLAACVNLVPRIRSIYRWQGEVHEDPEVLAIIKTTPERFPALRDAVVARHPYECPEVLAVAIADGHPGYLDWIAEETGEPGAD